MSAPAVPTLRTAARALVVCGVAGAAAATAASAATLTPSASPLAPWTPVVETRGARITLEAPVGGPGMLRFADRPGRAGAVLVRTPVKSDPRITVRAQVNVVAQRLAPGARRSVIEVGGRGGAGLDAGVVRVGDDLRWAVWFEGTRGAAGVTAAPSVLATGRWSRLRLVTFWTPRAVEAILLVDGRRVARTKVPTRRRLVPRRVELGLGDFARRGDVGSVLVRRAAVTGFAGRSTPLPTSGAGGAGPIDLTGGGTSAGGSPAAPGTTPGTGTVAGTAAPPDPNGPLPGRRIWATDFETGTIGSVSSIQRVASDRIRAVTSPAADGRYAARFEVRRGDNPIGFGDRAEVAMRTNEEEGQERWYSWATMFDPSFPSTSSWQVVSQFHSDRDGSPPVGFYAEGNRYRLQVWPHNSYGGELRRPLVIWSTPIQRGVWYRIRLHVKWSGRDDVGFVQLWVNGQPAGQKTFVRTMYPGAGNYFKFGYYRQSGIAQTGVVYHDSFQATQVSP